MTAARASALAGLPALTGLTADSRAVRPGFLFAALPGAKADGRLFIADALRAGAVAVLAPVGTALPPGSEAVLVTDDEPRRRFALIAAAFYGRQPATTVAITGTSGKTSTAQFTRQLWAALGHKAGAVGTLGVVAPGLTRDGALTTPDAVELHATLAELAAAGVDHVAMEASSHGIEQRRLDGVALAAAGFTNLSRDHLDYHGTMDAYFEAKAALFERLLPRGAPAVVNVDGDWGRTLAGIASGAGLQVLSYGRQGDALRLLGREARPTGQRLHLDVLGAPAVVDLPLVGAFQAYNVLCALGLALATGGDRDALLAALPGLEGVRGRLELVAQRRNGAAVYVDYAHKPDGLEVVLDTLRAHTHGRLVVAFGCGGDRDRGKRPIMGEIAARMADRVIVTDDNPRTEDAAAVRAEVLAGCPGAAEIGDRREAIRAAVRELAAGDVLVIAGKGHETYQIVGGETRHFDDAEEARAAVAEMDA
ncbi:MAG TPA: UDP-N-acetylmuramoyl-L-alanyl-D-glutamate--2,6-diaminopimelate ligase [Alphaproteobacteria bacterium]|nr:UDP-N-acetylmuramoyl-L-alanyl-D-glutamate--2,6-diaminopimelate ligase [Alphaproteobacteria bacterium]